MSQPPSAPGGVPTCYRHSDRETYISCQRCEKSICPDCMRSASVGFQCPDCVRQGAKETRQGQAMYGGARSGDPTLTAKVLIGLNVLVWAAIMATGRGASRLVDALSLTPQGQCWPTDQPDAYYPNVHDALLCRSGLGPSAQWTDGVADGAVWQVLTSAFTHVEIWHLAMNMLAIWFLGPQIEAVLGRVRFLAVYLVSALAGSAMVMWFSAPASNTLGASGAVFGLLGALLVLVVRARVNPNQLLLMIGLNFLITILWSDYISWQAHLGGFVAGLLVTGAIAYAPVQGRARLQWAAIAATLVLTLAAIALRALQL